MVLILPESKIKLLDGALNSVRQVSPCKCPRVFTEGCIS